MQLFVLLSVCAAVNHTRSFLSACLMLIVSKRNRNTCVRQHETHLLLILLSIATYKCSFQTREGILCFLWTPRRGGARGQGAAEDPPAAAPRSGAANRPACPIAARDCSARPSNLGRGQKGSTPRTQGQDFGYARDTFQKNLIKRWLLDQTSLSQKMKEKLRERVQPHGKGARSNALTAPAHTDAGAHHPLSWCHPHSPELLLCSRGRPLAAEGSAAPVLRPCPCRSAPGPALWHPAPPFLYAILLRYT